MALTKIKGVPFVQAGGDGGYRGNTQLIVIHCTANTAPARNEASYATRRPDGVSAHFYIDNTSVYQSLLLNHVAYGCYPIGNSRSIQFELVGRVNAVPSATWQRAAKYVAICAKEYNIPIRKVSPTQMRNGIKGICGHIDVTNAWGQGDHTDPGSKFPWSAFIKEVQKQYDILYKKPAPVKPAPAPKPPATGTKFTTHNVVKGDSLWAIALTYYGDGTKYKVIAADNKLNEKAALRIGQPLKIRQPHKQVHKVVKGETFYGISKKYNVPVATLQKLNAHRVARPSALGVGVVLRIK